MARLNRGCLLLALALVVATAGCADGDIDDEDGPSSELQILSLDNPSVDCSADAGFCALDLTQSCTSSAACVDTGGNSTGPCIVVFELQIQDWSASVANVPKNSLAITSPFNDITLDSVLVEYDWPACTTAPNIVGLGGVTVPASGNASITFGPIELESSGDACLPGNTADTTLTFFWHTATESETTTVTRELSVEGCS